MLSLFLLFYIVVSLIFKFSIIRTLDYPDFLLRSRRVRIIEVRLYSLDYSLNCTPLGPVTITNGAHNFKSDLRFALVRFWNYSRDYSLNCTPLGLITITNTTRSHWMDPWLVEQLNNKPQYTTFKCLKKPKEDDQNKLRKLISLWF